MQKIKNDKITIKFFTNFWFFFVSAVAKIKVLTAKETPLILNCENYTAGDKSVEWQKEGVDIRLAFAGKEDFVKFHSDNGSVAIYKEHATTYGNYTCNTTASANSSALFKIVRKYFDYLNSVCFEKKN